MKRNALRSIILPTLVVVSSTPLAGCSETAPTTPVSDATYYRDVKPIIESSCQGCHVSGGIAPFTLDTYDDVAARKDLVKLAVTERTMPPWLAADDCNDYRHNRSLTDSEIAAIADWVDAGAAEGDPKDAATGTPRGGKELSRVDLTLPMNEPYTPQGEPDDYRCFILDWPEQETRYITGIGIKAGVPAILHHMIAFVAKPEAVAEYMDLDAAEPGPGYTCFGSAGGTGRPAWIGGWAPGENGEDYPQGTGIEVKPASKIIMQLHYNTLYAKAQPDATKLLLKIDASIDKKASVIPWTDIQWVLSGDMPIPPHSVDVTHGVSKDPSGILAILSDGSLESGKPITIHSTGLHMHTFGKKGTVRIERKDGTSECLLDIPRWNFHWQGSYDLEKPVTFSPGDKLSLECRWDNPTDKELNWGEGTSDEMCLSVLYATQ